MTERTIEKIEAELNDKRAGLDEDLSRLRDKLQPQALLETGKEAASAHMLPLATTAGAAAAKAVKAHPVALALIGAGAAWMLWANRDKDEAEKPVDASALAGTKQEAMSRWEDEGGPMLPEREEAPEAAAAEIPDDDSWMEEADSLRERARGLLAQIDKAARDKLAPAADLAKERTAVIAALTSDVRASMAKGLEDLGEQAKSAALTAREAAYSARITATDVAQKGVTLAKENPLIVAALVGAAGVAIAAALPRNAQERGNVSKWRDQIFAAATTFAAGEIEKQIAAFGESLTQATKPKAVSGEAAAARPAAAGDSKVSRL